MCVELLSYSGHKEMFISFTFFFYLASFLFGFLGFCAFLCVSNLITLVTKPFRILLISTDNSNNYNLYLLRNY